jgi:hypothetical protein
MQATPTSVETSTVFVSSASNRFRIWWNRNGCYWQTDIRRPESDCVAPSFCWMYFGQASSLIQAMTNIAITL